MPQPTKIPHAFASSGDKNTIPDSTSSIGLASWSEGFPAITSVPFAQGGVAPKRADFNGIFNALSAAALWYQQGGVFVYDNATNYEIGNIVIYSGEIYVCKTANGPASALHSPANDNAETYWGRIYPQNGTFDRMFFSQTSGSYTAPYTGVYRITLKGGGGGGGPISSDDTTKSGCGGGEGGALVFYETLAKNQSYTYTIGAGGNGGVNYVDADTPGSAGTAGGTTSFVGPSGTWSASGGNPGSPSNNSTKPGGAGGRTFSTPGTAMKIPGTTGQAASVHTGTRCYVVTGGGSGGSGTTAHGVLGGGGAGAGSRAATNGGDGYILIEYAG